MQAKAARNGRGRAGSTRKIRAGGFSGIAATTWVDEFLRKINGKLPDGEICAGISVRSKLTARKAMRPAVQDSGKRCCIGVTTAGNSNSSLQSPRQMKNVMFLTDFLT